MKKIAILGSTGSIGKNALDLVDLHPELFEVVALAAGSNERILLEQCLKHRPVLAALNSPESAKRLSALLPDTRVSAGIEGLTEVAAYSNADIVVSAISGAAGLLPTYQALLEGKQVALANKEALVMAGDLLMPMVKDGCGSIVPVDSEHSALHQCLSGAPRGEVQRLILTASGGPFLDYSSAELQKVTVRQALQHPTWNMGPKITVDSATLMNKGLEVVEACHLFQIDPGHVDVAIHPQSVVHSIVEFIDGTMLAQMGITDMKVPLLYAMTYPERIAGKLPRLDITGLPKLEFRAPDTQRFPCLKLAYQSILEGGTSPAVMNAANEIAVEAFLSENLLFLDIPRVIAGVLDRAAIRPVDSLATILDADKSARELAFKEVEKISG